MARDRQQEHLLRDDPSRENVLIYADWLQQQGDPRGELMVIQLALAEEADPERRQRVIREQKALLTTWRKELLGPLPRCGPLVWKNGYVDRLTLVPDVPLEHVLEALEHPSAALIRSIDVSARPRDEGRLRQALQERGIQLTREPAIPDQPVFDGLLDVRDHGDFWELEARFAPDQESWLVHSPGYEFILGTRVGDGVHVFGCDDRTGPPDLGLGPVRTERFFIGRPDEELEIAFALILRLYHHEHREVCVRFTGGGLIPAQPGTYPVQLRRTDSIDDPALQRAPVSEATHERRVARERPRERPAWFDARAPLEAQVVTGRWMVWTTWQLHRGRRVLELSAIDLEQKRVVHRWLIDDDGEPASNQAILFCDGTRAYAHYCGRVHPFRLDTGEVEEPWALPTPRLRYRHRGLHPIAFHPQVGRAAWMIELCDGLRHRFPCLVGWCDRDGRIGHVLIPDNSPTGAHTATPLRPTVAVLDCGRVLALGHQFLWLVDPMRKQAERLAEAWDFDEIRVTRSADGYCVWTRGPAAGYVWFQ